MRDTLEHALDCLARGFRIFPLHSCNGKNCTCSNPQCQHPGKHPRTQHGVKDATTDEATVRDWWHHWPDSNIGVATGEGLVVLDVDPRHHGDVSLARLEALHGELPPATTTTGGGGLHYYFYTDEDIRSSTGTPAPGLDVKGAGGYVVAAGSTHASGVQYTWCRIDERNLGLPRLPQWLAQALTGPQAEPTPLRDVLALGRVATGERAVTLFRLGCAMRAHGFGAKAIYASLTATNTELCFPPLPAAEVWHATERAANYAPDVAQIQLILGARLNGSGQDPDPDPDNRHNIELLTVEEVMRLPPPVWVIQQYVAADSFVVVYGPPGVGKSFLCLDWGLSVATGRGWHGQAVRDGHVIYMAAEGLQGLPSRLKAYAAHHGLTPGDMNRMLVIPSAVRLTMGEQLMELEEALLGLPETPKLIIIDTLARTIAPLDENSSKDMGLYVGALDRVRTQTGAAVVVVHHTRKDSETERGSSALRGAADTMFYVRQVAGQMAERGVQIQCSKSKSTEANEPLTLEMSVVETGETDEAGQRLTSLVPLSITKYHGVSRPRVFDEWSLLRTLVSDFGADGATDSQWRDAWTGPRANFYRYKKYLIEQSYVRRTSDRRRCSFVPTEKGLSVP